MAGIPLLLSPGRLLVGLSLLLLANPIQAASLSVNPVRVSLDGSDSVSSLTLTNQGQDSVVMQASVNAWSIRGNEEHYEPTEALIVSPPVFEVAPGKSQIVRVGLRNTEPQAIEQSFRVFLEQSPVAPGDGDAAEGPLQLQVMLRLGIPVFVAPDVATKREVLWRTERLADGRLRVVAINEGNAHVKVSRLSLLDGDTFLAHSEKQHYILPDSRRYWLLDVPTGTSPPYRIKAETNEGELNATATTLSP
uniref:fimbrial biogenesis chaperone n=1 Tax=uncultured Halomonas sp. TaxID=173971 RepID=UPI002612FA07|nr:molecular chaperone [uncultured Halomonas sp.]